jgi:hypothetical protein
VSAHCRCRGQPSHGLPTVAHAETSKRERRLESQTFGSWNQVAGWLRRLEGLRGGVNLGDGQTDIP